MLLLFLQILRIPHVRWVPFHHSVVPQVMAGGDGFQLWKEAVNLLNKQSWTADKEYSFSSGVGCEAKNPTP
jgi:hypothetical protein